MAATPRGPSAAFFCPVPFLVGGHYLTQIRRRILQSPFLHPLGEAIKEAPLLWEKLSRDGRASHVAIGARGTEFAKGFQIWMETGEPGVIASQRSTIVSFPLLIITGIYQWCTYLEMAGVTQTEVIDGLNVGGIQGYCGGILSAVTVSGAATEESLGRRAADAFRIAFVLGVFMSEGEVGPPESVPDMLIVRLKYPGQDKELMEQFPGIYASATTNPVTICFAGRQSEIRPLKEYVASNRMFSIQTYPTGTGHDPRNKKHLANMLAIVAEQGLVDFLGADVLRVIVQSNADGEVLAGQSPVELAEIVLGNILCGRCEWYTVVEKLAKRLCEHYGESSHSLLLLGGYDCVPVEPFHQATLKISKIDVVLTLRELMQSRDELSSYQDDAIAVVGSACRIPGASNLDELWGELEKKTSMCEEVRPDRVPLVQSHRSSLDPKFTGDRKWFGNFVDNVDQFDHELFGLSPAEAAWMDPQQRILLELAFEALDSHGHLGHRSYRRDAGEQVGCFIGGTLLEYNEHTSTHAPTAYSAIGTMQAFQCGRISHHFGWYGPSETIDTACSSSLVAISRAVSAIRGGECHMAVAGGANILGGVNYYLDLAKARFLSPTGQCKPFDVSADGYCRADGAGIVVLKTLKDARAAGDEILAVIPGAGTNQGGLSKGITLPDGQAQRQLYQRVLRSAHLEPKDISYIECHGTGTQAGDPNEIGGLRAVFGDKERPTKLWVGSIKGNVGHAEAAAGVTGLMKVLSMLRNGKIPPQASLDELNPGIGSMEPFKMIIPTGNTQPWDAPGNVRRALVNSYGAAGSNATLVVCQAPGAQPKSAWWINKKKDQVALTEPPTYPLLVTAASKASLQANCRALAEMFRSEKISVRDALWTLSEKRQRHKFRAAMSVDGSVDPDQLAETLERTAELPIQSPPKQRPIVLVFGGQSQRTIHLNRSLYDTSPALRGHLAECDALLTDLGYPPVVPDLLNHDKVDQDVLLLQTGTFAIQYSCAKTWEDAGLPIESVIGHSFGELTALAFSGSISLRDGIRVVAERASLMQKKWGPENGVMLAVHSSLDIVNELVSVVPGLEIACHNSLASYVVVGTANEINLAKTALEEGFKGTRFQQVDVTHGFHSKFVDDILPGLQELDASLTFNKPRIHLELCLEDDSDPTPQAGHIGRHARNPVYFTNAVTRIAQRLGPSVWLEAGTDSPIIGMVKRAVPGATDHSFHPLKLQATRSPEKVLCDTTVALWKLGVDTTYWPWINAKEIHPVRLPRYQFSRKSFWTRFIDHPAELRKRLDDALQQQALLPAPVAAPVNNLVSAPLPGSNRYPVNICSSRFQQIVAGHAVCGQPMCPAAMYMECVAMSVQIYETSVKRCFGGSDIALDFQRVTFENPLSLRSDQEVAVVLDLQHEGGKSWAYRLESTVGNQKTIHARGIVAQVASPSMTHLKVLLSDRAQQLKSKPNAETINSRRFYTLFRNLVDYSAVLCGVESTTLHENWVAGTVKAPKQVIATHETDVSVLNMVDSAVADNFYQVLGLAMNTSDHVLPGYAYILSQIDNFTFLPGSNLLDTNASWTVIGHYNPEQSSKVLSGQVYVLDHQGDVVAYGIGVSFTRVRLSNLKRVLGGAVGSQQTVCETGVVHEETGADSTPVPKAEPTPIVVSAPVVPIQAPTQGRTVAVIADAPQQESSDPSVHVGSKVCEVVSRYTGLTAEEIPADSTMTELGIDSLAIVEFADEMGSLFKKEFPKDDLSEMTLEVLIRACDSVAGKATS